MRAIRIWAAAAVMGMAMVARAEDAAPAFKGDPDTLGVCPVSGEELGSMGDPISVVQGGRDIKLCCGGCPAKLKGDAAKYTAKLDALMIADQKPFYPLTTDVVSGDALPADDKVVDIVYFNRLVRLGSQKSAQAFMKDPQTYISKLDAAVIAKQKAAYPITKCVVSGEELGGDAIEKVAGNHLVRFCCDDCVNTFNGAPVKYLSMLTKGEAPAEGSGPHEHHDADHAEHN